MTDIDEVVRLTACVDKWQDLCFVRIRQVEDLQLEISRLKREIETLKKKG